MPLRAPNSQGRWEWLDTLTYESSTSTWVKPPLPEKISVTTGSAFAAPYLASGTVLTRDVRGSAMPLASNSPACASWMTANLNAGSGWGPTGLNTSCFGTGPIATFVVDSTAPGCDWQYMDSVAGADEQGVKTYLTGAIPLPRWAMPARNGDYGLAIYDLGTGIMREYFYAQPVAGSPGHWTAATGGYSLAKPYLADLGQTNYGMQLQSGTSAVVGMHNPLGFLGIAELLDGEIRHAVAFTCSNMGNGPSWPARDADGLSPDTNAPKEGQWCRLPDSVNPMSNPKTGQPYFPLTQLIIRAFQRYGGFATDKNLWVHAFNGEDGQTWRYLYGVDPWLRQSDADRLAGKPDGVLVQRFGNSNREIGVDDFPWELTQWAPVDWGRPSPDFWLRPGELIPWTS